MEAEADLDRVLVIDEAKRELTLSDERIEKAITQNGARLSTSPIKTYCKEDTQKRRQAQRSAKAHQTAGRGFQGGSYQTNRR